MKVWVEINWVGEPVRIFRSEKAAIHLVCRDEISATMMDRDKAVRSIRHAIFERSRGNCEMCGSGVTESSGHMHEQQHRGHFGEVSLANSLFICPKCHQRQHRDRNPRFTRRQS